MKKICVLLLAAALLGGCADDLLKPTPIDEVTVNTFYESEADIDQAMSGVYASMRDWPENIFIYLSEARSDNYIGVTHDAQRDWWDITVFDVKPEMGTLQFMWGSLYQMVNRANRVLESIGDISYNDPARKESTEAGARFLRAYAYFQLVRLFGRVPLVTGTISPEEGTKIGQSEAEEVYAFITSEMSQAIDALPSSYSGEEVGKLTNTAAKGILARVYLTMAGCPLEQAGALSEAKTLLADVIAEKGGASGLPADYSAMFAEAADNQYHLFEVQFVSGGFGAGSSFPMAVIPADITLDRAPFGATVSASRLALSDDLLTSYEADDVRFDATIDTTYVTYTGDTTSTPFYDKFLDANSQLVDRYDWGINFPLLRYADVLLMYAEVLAEEAGAPTSEAVALLNAVRERADLDAVQPASKAEFDEMLLSERRREFAAEGLRWFDLVRTCKAVEVMSDWFNATSQDITINENHFVYPIPQSEVDIFPDLYQQNPGY